MCLAVNADACKGCGLCISGCEPGTLVAAPQDLRRIEQTRARWNIWLKLPETPSATIERISASAQINPLAALLLSRRRLFAVAGGDGAEAGSGEKAAVHWATREDRFATYFSPLEGDAPSPIAVADYLQLDKQTREGKTPFVSVARTQGADVQLKVDPVLVRAADERLHAWRTLQELAGVVTPFTARVQQQAQEAVAEMHQAELEALKARYEQRIGGLEEDIQTDIAGRIRGRLLSLAGYDSACEARK